MTWFWLEALKKQLEDQGRVRGSDLAYFFGCRCTRIHWGITHRFIGGFSHSKMGIHCTLHIFFDHSQIHWVILSIWYQTLDTRDTPYDHILSNRLSNYHHPWEILSCSWDGSPGMAEGSSEVVSRLARASWAAGTNHGGPSRRAQGRSIEVDKYHW